MKRIILIIFSLVLFACDRAPTDEEASEPSGIPLNHPNGLTVNRLDGLVERATQNGFRFENPDWRMKRYSTMITVERQDTAPDVQGLASKRLGNDNVFYRIRKFSGGSGGPQYEFWATKPSGDHWIVVKTDEQQPWEGEPGFGLAWFLLKNARLGRPREKGHPEWFLLENDRLQ
jgi:hypothetical protein